MNGLGGLNKSPNGVVIGLVQLQLPVVVNAGRPRRRRPTSIVRHGRQGPAQHADAWIWSCSPNTRCTACRWTPTRRSCAAGRAGGGGVQDGLHRQPHLGLLLDHGAQPRRQSLQQRHHHRRHRARCSSTTASCIPGCRSSRGSRATSAFPVCDGPNGSKLALIICHDGMFPEMARECAYKGAEIMIRTAGYTAPIRHAWQLHQPGQRLLQSDGHGECLHVRLGRHLRLDGRGHDRQLRRQPSSHTAAGRPDEIITAEVRPDLVREARRVWGVENNIYQFGHRGYVAVEGRRAGLPLHLHARPRGRPLPPALGGRGSGDRRHGCGFAEPTREYQGPPQEQRKYA